LLAPENGIYFHGSYAPDELDKIAALYDVAIIPSLWEEAYGFVGPELLSRGLPVIATNRGAMSEYVRHEINGLIFDPAEPGALSHALERVVVDSALRRRMSANAVQPSDATPTFHEHLNAMEAVYHEVISAVRSPAAIQTSPTVVLRGNEESCASSVPTIE
jgi:glycosyltransferase involved in cell wall biosynthesis